jgi:hypothetical protein
MNGRRLGAHTSGGRILDAARAVGARLKLKFPDRADVAPDYADYEDLMPIINRELCIARLDEIRRSKLYTSERRAERERELVGEFVKLDLEVEAWAMDK